MSCFTFAFITPSYARDFQRCKLLCWSIKRFISFPVNHYIIVDRKDFDLFQQLADSNTKILVVEDVLPSWIKRVPVRLQNQKNIWLNLKGYRTGCWLIRGWLIQQIVKLAAAQYIEEDVLIFIDSDVAFIDDFDIQTLVRHDQVRLFRVEHTTNMDNEVGERWKVTATQLLQLPMDNNYYDFYVSNIVTWRRDNLQKLYEFIEKKHQKTWMEVIVGVRDLSEYVLYGIYSSNILGKESGHYDDHMQKLSWDYWKDSPMSRSQLKIFFQDAYSTNHKAVMISAKSSIDLSIEEFESFLMLKSTCC